VVVHEGASVRDEISRDLSQDRWGLRPSCPKDAEVTICFVTNRRLKPQHLFCMIRKLQSGEYRLYSRKKDAKTGKRKNLGTFSSRAAAQKHERAVQYFKHH
jgi:hypothetical protein